MVQYLMGRYTVSARKACCCMRLHRSAYYYRPHSDPLTALKENLALRRNRPWRHVSAVHRLEQRPANRPNEVWGMDFVGDQLADERRIRTLTTVDIHTRECLGIEAGFSLRAEHVVTAMNHLKYDRARPAKENQVRQWIGVFRRSNGLMGLQQPGRAGLQPSWDTYRQRDR
jgi:transposase InsO family protein